MKYRVLVIDDDEKLNTLLSEYLMKFGFEVKTVVHPHEGLRAIKFEPPDIIILDVMLPDMEGFEVCKEIRKNYSIPIVMLTARGEVTDRVVGLEIGADDYIPKPFEPRELVARMQAILRRGRADTKLEIMKIGNLKINFGKHEVLLNEEPITLTTAEFEILSLFIEKSGRVLDRDQILDHIRGIEWDIYNRSVDVLISRLRQKINDDPKHPKYIKTVWGAGYMFIGTETENS